MCWPRRSGRGDLGQRRTAALADWIEHTGMPFYTTPQGRGVVPEDHRFFYANARSKALREADVVLVVGTRLNYVFGHGQTVRFTKLRCSRRARCIFQSEHRGFLTSRPSFSRFLAVSSTTRSTPSAKRSITHGRRRSGHGGSLAQCRGIHGRRPGSPPQRISTRLKLCGRIEGSIGDGRRSSIRVRLAKMPPALAQSR